MNSILILLLIVLSSASSLSALDDPYRTETFAVREQGTLTVRTAGGSISVTGSAGSEVRVEMYVRKNGRQLGPEDTDLANYTITIRKDGNDVIAIAERKSAVNIMRGFNNESISFVVRVPRAYSSDLSTSGGSIRISDLSGTHDVSTSGGSLTFESISGELKGRTSGGSITADGLRGNATLSTSGGSIRIDDAEGSVKASTSGGSIRANFNVVTGPVEMSTSGGSVSLNIPRDLSFNLDARGTRVVGEDLDFNGRTEYDRMIGAVNGGGFPIRLRTSGGTIRIQHH